MSETNSGPAKAAVPSADTPRVDAVAFPDYGHDYADGKDRVVPYEYARQLERELNAVRAERNMLDQDARDLSIDRGKLKDELAAQSIPQDLLDGLRVARELISGGTQGVRRRSEQATLDRIDALLKKYGD